MDRPLHALFWMALSALGFSLMGVFVKRLAPVIPHFELVFFRSFINLVVVIPLMFIEKEPLWPEGKLLLFFRGVAGFGSLTALFYTLSHLPLAIAIMLGWCSPLFVFIFSWLAIGESVRVTSLRWVGIAFAGLLMIMRPDFSHGLVTTLSMSAILIGLAGSASAGLAYVAVRAATARVGVQTIILYFVGIATLLSAPLAARNWVTPPPREGIELLLMGLCASFGQYMMTQGYRFAAAGIVSTMSLVGAGYSAVFGWVLFDERLAPVQWLGMLILAAGIIMLALSSQKIAGIRKGKR